MNLLPFLLAFLAGAATALQAVVNSQARERLRLHFLQATLLNFGVGSIALIILCAIGTFLWPRTLTWPTAAALAEAPPWIWIGGFLGILYVSASVLLTPALGATLFLTLVMAGQLAGALLLDHHGTLGTPVKEVNMGRVLGVLLVLAGVLLVTRSTPAQ